MSSHAHDVSHRFPDLVGHRARINRAWLADEEQRATELIEAAAMHAASRAAVEATAHALVAAVRDRAHEQGPIDAFMHEYDLSSEEGVVLMCLAEALLRVPDDETAERLIADKLGPANWQAHLGKSESIFVNASTWGLMLTGRIVQLAPNAARTAQSVINRLVQRSGEPVVRVALRKAMQVLGHQFVMGRTIAEARRRAGRGGNRQYRYSFDMLGEAALTATDAKRYFDAYARAIEALAGNHDDVMAAPSISVKLSALHPRYEIAKRERIMEELVPRLAELAGIARGSQIALTVDAEEADRLRLSLDVFEAVYTGLGDGGWEGFGLAVQAYLKRAPAVLDWLIDLGRSEGRRIPVRLVKGAYWDTEIKLAQELGLEDYPVYTRKIGTDVAYLACARKMLDARDSLYPQFATHNAHTIAAVYHFADSSDGFELQRLHGMGEALYDAVIPTDRLGIPCRVYAPVGSHEDLLPYLVRRLLENGANTSFVNRISDRDEPIERLIEDPVETYRRTEPKAHPAIPRPALLYGTDRQNSRGLHLSDERVLTELVERLQALRSEVHRSEPLSVGAGQPEEEILVRSPFDHSQTVGSWRHASQAQCHEALTHAQEAAVSVDAAGASERAQWLEATARLFEQQREELISLLVREAGKTLPDCVAEVREAIDFCRYYAAQGRRLFAEPTELPGPTGESNRLSLHGRGPFVCISPWNFPLAIFSGQVAAALMAGNPVIAKPAEQTTLIGAKAVSLFHQAGVPREALQLIPGYGARVGAALTADPRVAGVAFTGSTETARRIHQTLAGREGPIATLVAETGGQNALLADSSALPEQLIKDVLSSAFGSAGQRCSALRVLFVQRDIADRVIEMLSGAMAELRVGDPGDPATDVGPVIDAAAREMLLSHIEKMREEATLLASTKLPPGTDAGHFVAPHAFEIGDIGVLEREVFGPILHVVRYEASQLDSVIDAINATGYGLTFGIHSRIENTIEHVRRRVRVGNCYVNRNMIGAVVGVQPFGGERLSGTGPKAGGPHYLPRFATERTYTVNTAAVGGNASLLALEE